MDRRDGSPLVSADWVEDRLLDPTVRVIEIDSGSDRAGQQMRIPGAVRWPWKEYLWHPTDREFPTPDEMAARLGNAGISASDTIVIVSDRVQWATYAYWVLTYCGIGDLKILEIVHPDWCEQDRPIARSIPRFDPVDYGDLEADPDIRVGRQNVREHLDDPTRLLLDARSPEEFRGERVKPIHEGADHGAHRWGRIPGATHLWYREFLHENDRYRSIPEIEQQLAFAGVTLDEETREIVTYCRLGHRACFLWFVFTRLLEYPDVKVYDGAWTEWGSIVGYPIETSTK